MTDSEEQYTLGAILFEGFEVLDLYGPLEMFGNPATTELVKIVTVAEKAGPVKSFNGPQTLAEYDFSNCPQLDLLLIPGGFGSIREVENPAILSFLKEQAKQAKVTMSVCSGSWLLAKAGLLDNRHATSNKVYFSMATQQSSLVDWVSEARWVEDGPFFTSSGVSAGMDMSLAVISSLFGREMAITIANGAEYVWNEDPDNDPFHQFLG